MYTQNKTNNQSEGEDYHLETLYGVIHETDRQGNVPAITTKSEITES